jgi:hypothetical protein
MPFFEGPRAPGVSQIMLSPFNPKAFHDRREPAAYTVSANQE